MDGISFYYVEVKNRQIDDRATLSDRDVESITEINEAVRASAISLKPEFTKIIGLKNSSPVLAFDLSYFDTGVGEEPLNQNSVSSQKKFAKRMRFILEENLIKNGRFLIMTILFA